ncbi:MAG: hypothetical protein MUE81_07910 [Thermoflexibacter sp.]|nr:hypothetical protein [Thermoflexibacter sp.]
MKKPIVIAFVAIIMLIANQGFAQDLTTWTWDTYKMQFDVPSNFKVIKNNANVFEASNGNITLSIYPRKGQNLTYGKMQNAIISWANQNGLTSDTGAEYLENLNGYWGCYIDGSAKGFPTSALLLIDPDYTDISLYVWISYREGYEDTAVAMLKSFTLQ